MSNVAKSSHSKPAFCSHLQVCGGGFRVLIRSHNDGSFSFSQLDFQCLALLTLLISFQLQVEQLVFQLAGQGRFLYKKRKQW